MVALQLLLTPRGESGKEYGQEGAVIFTIVVSHSIKLVLGNILIPGAFMNGSQSPIITPH